MLDMSRVLAGPLVAQMLGDLGAEVIKIEKPGDGDDSRTYGPPFLNTAEGKRTRESGFYLSANRNKRSVTVDLGKPEGQDIIRRIASILRNWLEMKLCPPHPGFTLITSTRSISSIR